MFKYPINVTIDTNVFDAAKYDFGDTSPLKLLVNYVQKGKIKVVLSDIVIREAKKHISKRIGEVCSISKRLRKEALNKASKHLIESVGLSRLLELEANKQFLMEKSIELFDTFVKDIDAEVLHSDLIDIDAIIDDYFEIRPPFEESEKKRKEFPDAFIASQIKERFSKNEVVAIISKDAGLKAACETISNHLFFDSLGLLFDRINREEKVAYEETMSIIEELRSLITSKITKYIEDNENIDLRGLAYDRDGISSGYDYNDYYLIRISNLSFGIHSIDELKQETSQLTLICEANFDVFCYYDDYDNAPWDPENREYLFVETVEMIEEHCARFGCKIELNRESKTILIIPFTVILGGDSRKKRYQVKSPEN